MPLPQVQPSRALCATCRGIVVLLLAPKPIPPHRCRSACARRPSAEISGNISFSSLWFLSRKLCPILCVSSRVHFTGYSATVAKLTQRCAWAVHGAFQRSGEPFNRRRFHLHIDFRANPLSYRCYVRQARPWRSTASLERANGNEVSRQRLRRTVRR